MPTDEQWLAILEVARLESVPNRVMLALAYNAALRREELCSLCPDDIGPCVPHAGHPRGDDEAPAGTRGPCSAPTGVLLSEYLAYRATLSRARGPGSWPSPAPTWPSR